MDSMPLITRYNDFWKNSLKVQVCSCMQGFTVATLKLATLSKIMSVYAIATEEL